MFAWTLCAMTARCLRISLSAILFTSYNHFLSLYNFTLLFPYTVHRSVMWRVCSCSVTVLQARTPWSAISAAPSTTAEGEFFCVCCFIFVEDNFAADATRATTAAFPFISIIFKLHSFQLFLNCAFPPLFPGVWRTATVTSVTEWLC